MGCICPKQQDRSTSSGMEDSGDNYVEFGKYIGERNCFGQKNGRGQYYYDNGDMYDGAWKRNKKHGYGIYTFLDGRKLDGFFEKDKFLGALAPTEKDEDADDPLSRNTGVSAAEEPMIRPHPQNLGSAEKTRERQKKIEEMKKKYHYHPKKT